MGVVTWFTGGGIAGVAAACLPLITAAIPPSAACACAAAFDGVTPFADPEAFSLVRGRSTNSTCNFVLLLDFDDPGSSL